MPEGDGHEWRADGWWRVLSDSGTKIWCETSNEEEVREALVDCPYPAHLEQHQKCRTERWATEPT